MIVGLGIDVVESRVFARELARRQWVAKDGIFTPAEIAYCNGGKPPERRYAACFAAKEAVLKALGTEIADLEIFREVEVELVSSTEYKVVVHDRLQAIAAHLGARRINLSLAVAKKNVGALAIVES